MKTFWLIFLATVGVLAILFVIAFSGPDHCVQWESDVRASQENGQMRYLITKKCVEER